MRCDLQPLFGQKLIYNLSRNACFKDYLFLGLRSVFFKVLPDLAEIIVFNVSAVDTFIFTGTDLFDVPFAFTAADDTIS